MPCDDRRPGKELPTRHGPNRSVPFGRRYGHPSGRSLCVCRSHHLPVLWLSPRESNSSLEGPPIVLRQNEQSTEGVQSAWSQDKHPILAERAREPEVPEWFRRHLFHRRESTVVQLSSVTESCPEVAELYRTGVGEWTVYTISDTE